MSLFSGIRRHVTLWLETHLEGVQKGTADEAKLDASPIIQAADAAGDKAVSDYLLSHVVKMTGIAPTPEGLTGLVSDVIDGKAVVPASAKEPLKLLIGGLAGGAAGFLGQAQAETIAGAVAEKATTGRALPGTLGGPYTLVNDKDNPSGVTGQNGLSGQTGLDIDPNKFNQDGTPKDPSETGGQG